MISAVEELKHKGVINIKLEYKINLFIYMYVYNGDDWRLMFPLIFAWRYKANLT